jgi:predicted nucleic acid-binding protein
VTLCDTGPLVALIDRHDSEHSRSAVTLRQLGSTDLVTTWACMTESSTTGGFAAQDELWRMIAQKVVTLHGPTAAEWVRIRELMRQYADAPMDFADATLCWLKLNKIFTLDRHLHVYRSHRRYFDVIP